MVVKSRPKDVHVGEVRRDKHGSMRCIAEAEGYVMVKRPYCLPIVKSVVVWESIPYSMAHPVEVFS